MQTGGHFCMVTQVAKPISQNTMGERLQMQLAPPFLNSSC